ncbi:hypothetical protein ACLOJK_009196 [Asimina triloba]
MPAWLPDAHATSSSLVFYLVTFLVKGPTCPRPQPGFFYFRGERKESPEAAALAGNHEGVTEHFWYFLHFSSISDLQPTRFSLLSHLSGHSRPLFRLARSTSLAAPYSAEAAAPLNVEYGKRNYAKNVSEYNTVLSSLVTQRRHCSLLTISHFLLRDVYEDMLLDGVQPIRDTFHSLIIGTMKGSRLQDAFFFRDEMKTLGLVPDDGDAMLEKRTSAFSLSGF